MKIEWCGCEIETYCPQLPPNWSSFKVHGAGVDFVDPSPDRSSEWTAWSIWSGMPLHRMKVIASFAYCAWMERYDECLEVIKVGPTTQDQAAAAEEMDRATKAAAEWLEWGGWNPRLEGL